MSIRAALGVIMNTMQSIKIWRYVVQLIALVSYLATALLWILAGSIVTSYLIKRGTFDSMNTAAPHAPIGSVTMAPEMQLPLLIIVSIIFIALTIFMLVVVPKNIVQKSSKNIGKTSDVVVGAIAKIQHKKISTKRKKILSSRARLCIKLALTIIPLFLIIFLPISQAEITREVILTISLPIFVIAVFGWSLQWLVARLVPIEYETLW